MTKISVLLSAAFLALGLLSGCHSVAMDPAGQNIAVYQFGEFRMLVNTTAPIAAQAAQKAVKQLDLYQTHFSESRYEAEILARARNDQKIRIGIEETNSRQTTIRVRWGEAGDMKKSQKLCEAIDALLR